MMTYPQKERYDINDLIEVIRMLRLPDGCRGTRYRPMNPSA